MNATKVLLYVLLIINACPHVDNDNQGKNSENPQKIERGRVSYKEKTSGQKERSIGIDTDGDGLTDDEERNAINIKFKTDPLDADTDDDGLSDGDERGLFNKRSFKFYMQNTSMSPTNPDSDLDGLPDGLEMGITDAISAKGNIKGTDLDATFDFILRIPVVQLQQTRKCFIPDRDPLSITDPGSCDSNGDGLSDGYQDANGNGMADPGETDPAAGLVSDVNLGPIKSWQSEKEISLQPFYMKNGARDEGRDMSETWLPFQSSIDGAPPEVVFSRPDCLRARIYPKQPGTRIQIISIEWLKQCDDVIKVIIKSPYLIHGQTDPIMIKSLPAKKMGISGTYD